MTLPFGTPGVLERGNKWKKGGFYASLGGKKRKKKVVSKRKGGGEKGRGYNHKKKKGEKGERG